MDLSTLFYALVRDRYLKPNGTLAFVMPRSVITGAKQHRPFQQIGFTRILDFENVTSLFNVPACVLIQQGETQTFDIPTEYHEGKLPDTESQDEVSVVVAEAHLMTTHKTTSFADSLVRSPYYYKRFLNGATLYPRNLCFIKPRGLSSSGPCVLDNGIL